MKNQRTSWLPLAVLTFLLCAAGVAAVFAYVYASHDTESREAIMNRRKTGIVLLDRHGREFFSFDQSHDTTFVPLADIPLPAQRAFIAAEDKGFYRHWGFSPTGIARAAYYDLRSRSLALGGSTITQQLVKNTYFNPEKSFLRKFQEIVLAVKLERTYTKDEILEMYLNSVYFGEGVFGIENAAQRYFAKSAKDLSLAESSLLAGILPAPAYLSPLAGEPERSLRRQSIVLNGMVEEQYISAEVAGAAKKEVLSFNTNPQANNIHAPHFALLVRKELERLYGEEESVRQGLVVRTTLDLDWQMFAEKTVRERVEGLQRAGATNGAAVAIDPQSGEVLVLVGSVDWRAEGFGKVNMASAPRQTGSTFKPIVYAAGIEGRELTAATRLMDVPTTFGKDYKPHNYDNRYRGPVLARYALANSLNVPAVQATQEVGPASVAATARRLGITTIRKEAEHNLSVGLGTEEVSLLELTNAYAALANEGTHTPITSILSVEDKFGRSVEVPTGKPQRAISPETAFIVSSILSDDAARSSVFGRSLAVSRPAAVKTGTTQDYRDAFTVGYTRNIAVGAWVGNNDRTPMRQVAGALGAAPIWRDLTEHAFQHIPAENFVQPATVAAARVCRSHGLLATKDSPGNTEYFIRGTEPTRPCPAASPSPSPTSEEGEEGSSEEEKEKKEPKEKPKPKLVQRPEEEGSDD